MATVFFVLAGVLILGRLLVATPQEFAASKGGVIAIIFGAIGVSCLIAGSFVIGIVLLIFAGAATKS